MMQGEKPMTKNVSVVDESGRLIGSTYPKRARGLVKNGRARYVSCETEDTICLTCPPDNLEDKTMTEDSLKTVTCTPSAEYALHMLECIALDTETLRNAVEQVSNETDNGIAHMIEAHEKTNRELISFYTQMYNEYKPAAPAKQSNTVARFTEIADMLKGLNRNDYDEHAWNTLMEAAKAQLSRNY